MTFLSPLYLWFLPAALIPIGIHLLHQRRHQVVPWAAMQFLWKTKSEDQGVGKLRYFLILLCRTLAITVLVLAMAKPLVSDFLSWGVGSPDTIVLIFDRSSSMEHQALHGKGTKREEALQQIQTALRNLKHPKLILCDSATEEPQMIYASDALAKFSAIQATDTAARLPVLLRKAAESLALETGKTEIWIASDRQKNSWQLSDQEEWQQALVQLDTLAIKPVLRILSISGSPLPNDSLRLWNAKRQVDGIELDLEILSSNENNQEVLIPLILKKNGTITQDFQSLRGKSIRFQKKISIGSSEDSGFGKISLAPDANSRDNDVYFFYDRFRSLKTLLVSPKGELSDYLSLAAAPPGFGEQRVIQRNPEEFTQQTIADYSLVIWAAPLPKGVDATYLKTFLEEGGQMLCLPGFTGSENEFLGLRWGKIQLAEEGDYFFLNEWQKREGLLKDGVDGTPIPAEKLRALRRCIPQGDGLIFARWSDGEPFLFKKIVERGAIWFLGSNPDSSWSNLGDGHVLLPVIQRISTIAKEQIDASDFSEVGKLISHRDNTTPFRRIDESSEGSSPYHAGVYRGVDQTVAVNRSYVEDDASMLKADELVKIFSGFDCQFFEDQREGGRSLFLGNLWKFFVSITLIFLFLEGLLCLPKKRKSSDVRA